MPGIIPYNRVEGRLGTHLTLDLAGRIRFGPDIQWITDPRDYKVNDAHLDDVYEAVSQYLPNVDRNALAGDYTGIRYGATRLKLILDPN